MNAIKGDFSIDPYEVLGISKDSTDAQIVKSFRKCALKWHPDKNLDRKQLAEEMFLKISQAFELLSDPAAKEAYDRLQATKTAKAIYVQKRRQTDSANRTRLREELEKREANIASSQEESKLAQKNLEKEIERLRKEGSRLLQHERDNIEKEVKQNAKNSLNTPSCSQAAETPARLKVKWKAAHREQKVGEDELREIFGKYGEVSAVVISASGKGSAIVEFERARDALRAETEKGTAELRLKISWISERPKETPEQNISSSATVTPSSSTGSLQRLGGSTAQFDDFEAEVLAKMLGTTGKKPGDTASKFDGI